MKSSISIVIPNYNGLDLLQRHLPSVVKFASNYQILLVDDASTDNSVAWTRATYPQIDIVVQSQNQGFVLSVNHGVRLARHNLILLLNSDVSLHSDTIPHLLPHFQDESIFAVGAKEILPDGSHQGKSIGAFQRGLLIHSKATKLEFGPTLWVFGASGMFRRDYWLKLGGLDPLFKPAYWEDIDLGYRAWKAGLRCLFEPRSTVAHDHEATMARFLKSKKTPLAFKNQLLFYWKNITDPCLIVSHLLWMPYHLIVTSYKTKGAFLFGFILALHQIPEIFNQAVSTRDKLTDLQVINKLHS